MKNYELTYLISPDSSASEVTVVVAKIINFIREKEGSITSSPDPSRIKLAYLINKKTDAFLVSCYFSLAPELIIELKKFTDEQNEIMRNIIIIKKKIKEPIIKIERSKIAVIETDKPEKKPKESELKEIDAKIDEILS